MALLWALMICGVAILTVRIIVLGDDSVTALRTRPEDEDFNDKFIRALQRLGFKVKLKSMSDPDLVEFCSGRFWCTAEGRVWGPKPGRWLSKIGYSVGSEEQPLSWFKGVLLGVKQNTGHVPLLGPVVKHLLSLLKDIKAKAVTPEGYLKTNVRQEHKPCPQTYQQFFKIYDLNQSDLDSAYQVVSRVDSLPFLVDHPVFDRLVEVDS